MCNTVIGSSNQVNWVIAKHCCPKVSKYVRAYLRQVQLLPKLTKKNATLSTYIFKKNVNVS